MEVPRFLHVCSETRAVPEPRGSARIQLRPGTGGKGRDRTKQPWNALLPHAHRERDTRGTRGQAEWKRRCEKVVRDKLTGKEVESQCPSQCRIEVKKEGGPRKRRRRRDRSAGSQLELNLGTLTGPLQGSGSSAVWAGLRGFRGWRRLRRSVCASRLQVAGCMPRWFRLFLCSTQVGPANVWPLEPESERSARPRVPQAVPWSHLVVANLSRLLCTPYSDFLFPSCDG